MQELGKLIAVSYFTPVFLVLIQVLTVVISVRSRKKFKELGFLHLYPILSLLQTVISFGSMAVTEDYIRLVQQPSVSIFLVIEFVLIYSFFFNVITHKRNRLVLKVLFIGYLGFAIITWIFSDSPFRFEQPFLVQAMALLIPSIIYFFQLFNVPLGRDLISQPVFWMNIGVLFFFSSTIPLFLLVTYFSKYISLNESLYSINYIAYCIFFLIICKAYLCKTVTRYDYSLS